ncbi:MAG: YdcF family protein [Chloroflexi bacterium]|nr:YdcF family protein [Chloroflexota bacterium]
MKYRLASRNRIGLFLLLVTVILLYSFRHPLLIKLGAYPFVQSELKTSDLIVVISGTLPEIHYGIDLYKAGYAPKILFVGDFPVELTVMSQEPFEVAEKPWEEIAGHMAVSAGIPQSALLFSHVFATSTYERVASFLTIAQQHNFHSLIVISDRLHSRRIAESAQKIRGQDSYVILSAPTPLAYVPEGYRFHPESWWANEQDLKDVFDEWIKLGFYWVRY